MKSFEEGAPARQLTNRIAGQRLELDDLGTLMLQELGAVAAWQQARQVEHANAVQQHALLG